MDAAPVKVTLIDGETNTAYQVFLSDSDAQRIECDLLFATKILENAKKTEGKRTQEEICSASCNEEREPVGHIEEIEKTETYNWAEKDVLLLINTYKDKFTDENKPKGLVWKEVVEHMSKIRKEENLPEIPLKKCITKMESLKRHYKSVKDSNNKSGNSRTTWKYYEAVDELFGNKPWVKPISVVDSSVSENESSPPPKRSKKSEVLKVLQRIEEERRQREEVRQKQHLEKMEVLKSLNNIMERLLDNNK